MAPPSQPPFPRTRRAPSAPTGPSRPDGSPAPRAAASPVGTIASVTTTAGGRRAVASGRAYDLDRLRSFSDSVFAVAITILAATFRLPEVDPTGPALGGALAAEWPRYLSYLAGFTVIGFFWLSHHRLVDLLVRADGVVALLNLVFLFFVALFPFSTLVLGEYRSMVPAHVLFNANAVILGLANLGLWIRTTRHHRDVDPTLDARALQIYRWRAAVFPVVFAVALAACAINERAAVASWMLVFVGRPLIRLILGPMPAEEQQLETAEHDDSDASEEGADEVPGGGGPAGSRREPSRVGLRGQRALGRLTGFSDNVYAFAVTVLVLPLATKLPDQQLPTPQAVEEFLRVEAWPALFPYALGFAVIGLFWTLHVRVFSFVRAQDATLRVLNLVHLLTVATLPFATTLLAAYDSSSTAIIVYAGIAGLCGGALAAVTFYATGHHRLIAADVPDTVVRMRRWSSLVVPVSFLASMAVAHASPTFAQTLWYLGFVVVRVLQRRWVARHPDLGFS